MPDFETQEPNEQPTDPITDPEDIQATASESEATVETLPGIESLMQELEDCRAKSEEYLDGWQRSRADFANYKRRIEREQSQVYQNAVGSIVKRYIEIIDDLERALKNRPQKGEGATWAEGIELIYRKFLSILEAEGVTQQQAQGLDFDPNLHEAISSEPNEDYESGQIIEVIKNGYMLGERVLRPALVRVAQ
jgi:molecular chaperone GrpE